MSLGIEFVVEVPWHGQLQEDFHLNAGAEFIFSPVSVPDVFASRDHGLDVWRIRTDSFSYLMLWG